MKNLVAIVGRPNVGKSTLFNRLTESRKAIVDETSGVTRDRHYGMVEWNGKEFGLIDTGGYIKGSEDVFETAISNQVKIAISEADIIIFLVDVMDGITGMDKDVADILRKSSKKIILTANKVDNGKRLAYATEFYNLALGEIFTISAINGSGTGELLDEVVTHLPDKTEELETETPRIAVTGKPNVGKSTLINALLGEERNIVTPVAGTTRDTIYCEYNKYDMHFHLVDTAGLRKKGKIHENIEFYSVIRTIKAIEMADVCLLMLDAQQGMEAQDLNIFSLIVRNKKGVVVLVNKWDLVEKDHKTHKEFKNAILEKMAPFKDVPIIFTSATGKQRIFKAIQKAMEVYHLRTKKIKTSELNEFLLPIIEKNPPPSIKGRYVRIKYVTQLKTHYPSFALYCNYPKYIKDAYSRFIENKLREHFDFTGVPIQIYFRKK